MNRIWRSSKLSDSKEQPLEFEIDKKVWSWIKTHLSFLHLHIYIMRWKPKVIWRSYHMMKFSKKSLNLSNSMEKSFVFRIQGRWEIEPSYRSIHVRKDREIRGETSQSCLLSTWTLSWRPCHWVANLFHLDHWSDISWATIYLRQGNSHLRTA